MTDLRIPVWTLGERLAKARSDADVDRAEMAELLGVHVNTISNYEHNKTKPPTAALRVWGDRCLVPLEWLRNGEVSIMPFFAGGAVNPCDQQVLVDDELQAVEFDYPRLASVTNLASRRAS